MAELEDDMDQLFREAAENYRLKEPSDDWDGIAGRLTGEPPVTAPAMETPGNTWTLLLLLLFMLPVCGYLAHLIITNYKQHTLYATPGHRQPSPSTDSNAKGDQSIKKEERVNDRSITTVTSPAKPAEPVNKMPVDNMSNRTITNRRNAAGGVNSRSDKLTKQTVGKPAVPAPSFHTVGNGSKKDKQQQIARSSTNDTHPPASYVDDDTLIAKSEINKQLQEPVVTINDGVLPEASTRDSLKQTAKEDFPKAAKDSTGPRKKAVAQRPQKGLLLGIAAGPEWNQVQRQRYTRAGYDIGIVAGYQFNNRVSLEASAFVARKYYYSSGKYFNLKMPGMDVVSLQGSSTIIEVPLKLKYNFLPRQQYSLFASAGLISYFLTDEQNDYILLVNGGETNMTRKYVDAYRYFAAAVDVSIGYQHYFGRLTTLRIEPYVQLPLKGIGVGSMQVMSSGIHLVFTRGWGR